MTKLLSLTALALAIAANPPTALADVRFDYICVTSASEKDTVFVYDNLLLTQPKKNTETPVTVVISYQGPGVSTLVGKGFERAPKSKLKRTIYASEDRVLYGRNDEGTKVVSGADVVNSENSRIVLKADGQIVLAIPFINGNHEDEIIETSLRQSGMIFGGKKVSTLNYSYCGQGLN